MSDPKNDQKKDLTPIILTTSEIPPLTDEVIETALGDSLFPETPTEESTQAREMAGNAPMAVSDDVIPDAMVFEPIMDKDETKDIEKTQAFDLDAVEGQQADSSAGSAAGITGSTEGAPGADFAMDFGASENQSPATPARTNTKSVAFSSTKQTPAPTPDSDDGALNDSLIAKVQQNSRLFSQVPNDPTDEDQSVSYGDTASLRILGKLRPHERDRLLYILSRESVNIREFDLESQWESGTVLIPHVSEYVLILLTQSLKDAAVRLERIPSDVDPEREIHEAPRFAEKVTSWSGKEKSGTGVVILPEDLESLEDIDKVFELVDSSAILPELYVGAEKENLRLEEAVVRLKNHLKARANAAGANAIVQVQVKINPIYHRQETHVVVSGIPVLKKL